MEQQEQREHLSGLSETVIKFSDTVAKGLAYIGGLVAFVTIGILLFTLIKGGEMDAAHIASNIGMAKAPALMGMLAVALGVGWLMWGEELAGPILVIIGLGLVFLPAYAGAAFGETQMTNAKGAVDALSAAGAPAVIGGLIMIVGDLVGRVRIRAIQGARAEMFKYGQNVREERDTKNVFLGKCWQLPFCRKFVRERCPIYHAKRTCWKERVGCMCEEQVIRSAMSEAVISKDSLAAAKRIPKNNTLTPGQKKQRCERCIIYNEHQKHKYRAMLPAVVLGSVLVALVLYAPFSMAIQRGLTGISGTVVQVTGSSKPHVVTNTDGTPVTKEQQDAVNAAMASPDVTSVESGKVPYAAIIYCTCVLVAMAYAVRVVEFLIFKYII